MNGVQQKSTLAVFGIFLILRSTILNTVEVSNACYGYTCITAHNLRCSSGHIAIQDAFYMDRKSCMLFFLFCGHIKVHSIPQTGKRYNFTDTELDTLHGDCSTQSTCRYRAGRQGAATFSVIIYQCIREIIHTCDISNIKRKDTSLILRGHSDENTCICSISEPSTTVPTSLTLSALEMRQTCNSLTVSVDGVTVSIPCSQITSNQLLLNTTSWLYVTLSLDALSSSNSTVIWIGIQGTNMLNINCNELPPTTLAETTQTVATETKTVNTMLESTTGLTEALSAKVTNNGFGGVFAAGLFTGLGIAAVIAGIVYFVWIRRRLAIKKPDPHPGAQTHSTYSGLTHDTYDVINRPEGFTRSSEPSQAPIYEIMDF